MVGKMELQYLNTLGRILDEGDWKEAARLGLPRTKELFGVMMRCNLQEEFPLLTTKRIPFQTILKELLWIISGDTNVKTLVTQGVEIWTRYAYKYYVNTHKYSADPTFPFEAWYNEVKNNPLTRLGSCGKIYGRQWRSFGYGHKFDQVKYVIKSIKESPNSRYHVISAWDPISFLMVPSRAALPSCPAFMQFSVRQGIFLDLSLTQRSADMFLGVPFDLASYATLLHIIAKLTGYVPGEFIWFGNSVHIYENHLPQIYEQLGRKILPAPDLVITNGVYQLIEDFSLNSFKLCNYESHPAIKGDLAVGNI